MAVPNPNPSRISAALWRLWTDFDRFEASALLGGIYANKPAYHNYRNALPSNDYSVRDVAADRQGSGSLASAIDLTLSDAAMRKYTGRLDVAARKRDRRLYPPGDAPVLREFIGTKDGRTVYCYVLTGGVPLGVGADAGPDWGRDSSHLWHMHLSIIRKWAANWLALSGVLSVLMGESLEQWEGSGMAEIDNQRIHAVNQRVEALTFGRDSIKTVWSDNNPTADEAQWSVQTLKTIAAGVKAIATALPGVDEAVRETLQADLQALSAGVQATAPQVVSLLAAQPAEDAAELLIASVGDERARALADAILAATGGADASE
jgi:hypothetical protein